MWICRFLQWKSCLCSLRIICNTLSFVLRFKYFRYLSYPRATYLYKNLVSFSLIDPWGLDNWLLVPWPLISIGSSHIGNNILYCCSYHSFLSEFPSSSWIMDIPNVMEIDKFYYLRIWGNRIVNISISSTKIKPRSLGIISFHIQGLHIFASILSDFRYLARVDWRDNFSFCLLWYLRPPAAAPEAGEPHVVSELVRTEPDTAVGRYRIGSIREQTWRRRLRPIASGLRQSDWMKNWQRSAVECRTRSRW
jgi:hypothetical protein